MTLRSKRGVVLVCVVLGLVLFLVRPGAARLKTRIATSIGMALQRQVEIGRVHIRLLPRPGFDLERQRHRPVLGSLSHRQTSAKIDNGKDEY